MNKNLKNLINNQINKEIYSSYLYLSISNFFKKQKLFGLSSYFSKQAKEELEHAEKFNDYLYSVLEEVTLEPIEAPNVKLVNVKDALDLQLKHEKYVTSLINDIYDEAEKEKDRACMHFLDWFIDEQVEEERNALELLNKYELLGKTSEGLYLLDEEVKKR